MIKIYFNSSSNPFPTQEVSLIRLKNITERFTSKSTKSRRFGNSLHVTSQRNPTKLTTWVYRFSRYRFSKRHELKSGGDENCIIAVGNCLMTARRNEKGEENESRDCFSLYPSLLFEYFSCFHFSLINHRKQREKQIRVEHNRDRVEAFIKNVRKIRLKEARRRFLLLGRSEKSQKPNITFKASPWKLKQKPTNFPQNKEKL